MMRARPARSEPVLPERPAQALVTVQGLTMRQQGRLIQQGLDFRIVAGEVLAIVGPSGCGKSTLLRHLTGLQMPASGRVFMGDDDLHAADEPTLARLRRRFGVMFQSGALWSAMSVGENLMLPMRLFTDWPRAERERQARFRLALVGLDGAFDRTPSQLSGGMRKRAALARALALDPEILYLDEPGSGLDPLNAGRLDDLLLHLRDHLGTTVVMVTHEIDSVRAIADRVLFLDDQEKTMTALGAPDDLLTQGPQAVREFLARGHVLHDPPGAGR